MKQLITLRNLRALGLASLVGASLTWLSPLQAASVVDASVGGSSFAAQFTGVAPQIRQSGAEYQLGFVLRPDDNPEFRQYHAQFLVTGDAGAEGFDLRAGLGGRLVYLDLGPADGLVLAFGGEARAKLPGADRFSLGVQGYIAPSVTAFSDLDGYRQVSADVAYEIIRGGAIYLGARHIRYSFDNARSNTVDGGAHVGLRLTF